MENSVKKIVIIGPESTGKSTLSAQLAAYYHTHYVAEYAREYLEKLDRDYIYDDLLTMATGHLQTINLALSEAQHDLLFIDTDLQVFKVWSEYKYGLCAPDILKAIETFKVDAYILTDIDMPWEYDVLREHPEPELRSYFFEKYKSIVIQADVPYCIVSGNEEMRLEQAIHFIDELKKK